MLENKKSPFIHKIQIFLVLAQDFLPSLLKSDQSRLLCGVCGLLCQETCLWQGLLVGGDGEHLPEVDIALMKTRSL